jgi:hypothetical protein
MPIPFQCSGCGKQYKVDEKMAGKQATCRCGATTRVPSDGVRGSDESVDDWVAAAFHVPAGAPPAAEPEPAATATPETPKPLLPPDIDRPKPRRRRKQKPGRWHKLVAVASIVYGALAALVSLVFVVLAFPGLDFGSAAEVVLGVAIAVGGVLIRKRHEQGPACAGLACIFLCVFSGGGTLLSLPGVLAAREFVAFLRLAAFLLIVYSVPVGIAVWSLRQEIERQRLEAEEQLDV